MRVKAPRLNKLVSSYAKRFGSPPPASLLKNAALLGKPSFGDLQKQIEQSLSAGRPVPEWQQPEPTEGAAQAST